MKITHYDNAFPSAILLGQKTAFVLVWPAIISLTPSHIIPFRYWADWHGRALQLYIDSPE